MQNSRDLPTSATEAGKDDPPRPRSYPLVAVFGLLAFGACAIVFAVGWRASEAAEIRVRADALRWAHCVSSTIDAEQHAADARAAASTTFDAARASAPLTAFARSLSNAERVYTLTEFGGVARVVYDAPIVDPNIAPVAVSAAVDIPDEGRRALAEGVELVSVAHAGSNGEVISAYAPFFDRAGHVAGVVGIDWSADTFLAPVRFARTLTWLGIALAAAFSAVCTWFYASQRAAVRAAFDAQHERLTALEVERVSTKRTLAKTNAFMATMSHEVRTPLTAILGFTDLLLDPGNETSVLRAHAQTIRRNGQHLMAIVNDILDLSKSEAGMLRIEREPCDVGQIVKEVVDSLAPRASEKHITLGFVLGPNMPRAVRSDPMRLRQILLNLCSNAVKFTESGHVQVRVELTADGREVFFEVNDTGIGIDPRHLKHLFQPYQQADRSIARRFGGTGLGLAISKRLAAALGGDIVAESRVGQGSTFRLTIPAEIAELPDPQSISTRPVEVLGGWPRPNWRIFVVEDQLEHQKLLYALLRRAGHSVEMFDTGARALRKVRECEYVGEPPTVVILDVHLPRQDGLSTVREMRAHHYRGPVLALTADSSPTMRTACLEAGCDDVATKPIDREALFAALDRLIRVESALGSASRETPRTS